MKEERAAEPDNTWQEKKKYEHIEEIWDNINP